MIRDTTVEVREISVVLNDAANKYKKNTLFLDQTLRIPFTFIERMKHRGDSTYIPTGEDVTTAFIGADAVDVENGIFNSHFAEVGIKKMMIGNSQKAVLLADHSKFLEKALIKVADLEEFDTVITDSAIESRFRSRLKKKIKNMVIV